ncbi:bifunctional diaminohydroxyphosphoribosylaminopyrimidine deaminase/5-amino-6-(5-phosphoribosylamino)uracil reductase RibD [Plasticicumulans sp.]|uniref:bifunctional diaminohydroxyphosphoribosylaminopyrimidine deaminase/5-amino-6-(5-phosphoribosylamino)uracil reductase RibD n=2 Tax=Plasticicumulans sp. TaxID=2307179 RepID=UPI002D1FA947|nr:bifunctional diaminohydroxyphosphoribosylaminopyrimidine deaminase/5-amino-6-(5-phosphoribosylamino)uracil reductase RibD [Plasticicumulans sp.]
MSRPADPATDARHMARALALAARGLNTTSPNPRVGCVLVAPDGEVIGEGWHERAGEPHAEVHALRAAGGRARGATAYVTLEPCSHHGRTPPCADALIEAGVARVVAAMADPNPQVAGRGLARLRAAGIAVECGLLEAEAQALNAGFVRRMTRARPWLRLKLAASLDARTALASGESQWITGEAARTDVQRLRARACAVLTGSGTVLADDPGLDVRLPGTQRQPLRVVLDTELRTPLAARLIGRPGRTLIVCGPQAGVAEAAALTAYGVDIERVPVRGGGLDLDAVLASLAARGCNEVHAECGARLAGALLAAGRVDELVVYLAPLLLGDAARGLARLPGLERMEQRLEFDWTDVRSVGRDLRLTLAPRGPSAPAVS